MRLSNVTIGITFKLTQATTHLCTTHHASHSALLLTPPNTNSHSHLSHYVNLWALLPLPAARRPFLFKITYDVYFCLPTHAQATRTRGRGGGVRKSMYNVQCSMSKHDSMCLLTLHSITSSPYISSLSSADNHFDPPTSTNRHFTPSD